MTNQQPEPLFHPAKVDGTAPGRPDCFDAWVGQPLLASMEAGGIDWPSSCRNGTCRTCLAKVLEGEVCHTIAWPGLSAEERAAGYALPCVAEPLGPVRLAPPD
ncbi:MAG TPA: 2Fe-2S iron-sulfur cluster binding domain-containing protein [Burkholderiaceae bacterium]|nr:2Fe-2S iron-sulfur cluster binding domain-containing protein [Burkholderiaceae bacterium]